MPCPAWQGPCFPTTRVPMSPGQPHQADKVPMLGHAWVTRILVSPDWSTLG